MNPSGPCLLALPWPFAAPSITPYGRKVLIAGLLSFYGIFLETLHGQHCSTLALIRLKRLHWNESRGEVPMKSLVVYSSQSGNTQKLAETVYAALPGHKDIMPVDEAPEPDGYDCVAVGFWLQAGKPDPKTAAYLARVKDTRLFLFATHGAAAGSAHVRNAMDHARSLAPDASVIGSFGCQGEVNPKALEKIRAKVPPPPWIQDADGAVGHPDQEDLATLEATLKALNLG
jgi:flavodoxin